MSTVASRGCLEAPVTMNRGSLRCHGARLSPEERSRALRATWRFVAPLARAGPILPNRQGVGDLRAGTFRRVVKED